MEEKKKKKQIEWQSITYTTIIINIPTNLHTNGSGMTVPLGGFLLILSVKRPMYMIRFVQATQWDRHTYGASDSSCPTARTYELQPHCERVKARPTNGF